MALKFATLTEGGGGWFKADDEKLDYKAFLIEVVGFTPQRPTAYGPRDSAIVNMTVFKTDESLNAGEPDEVFQAMRVEQSVLCRTLSEHQGEALIVVLAQSPSKKPGQRPAWVWRAADSATQKKVVAYAAALEEAENAALASAPSFD